MVDFFRDAINCPLSSIFELVLGTGTFAIESRMIKSCLDFKLTLLALYSLE